MLLLYRPRFWDTGLKPTLPERAIEGVAGDIQPGQESVVFDQPTVIVGFPEREQRLSQFLDGLEGPHPEQVLLQEFFFFFF